MNTKTFVEKATAAWGEQMPEWVRDLAAVCDQSTQSLVAAQMGYTAAVVSTVLANAYTGDMLSVERSFKGAYQGATTQCPVLGEIPTNDCIGHQRARQNLSNPMRRMLFDACLRCANRCRGGAHARG